MAQRVKELPCQKGIIVVGDDELAAFDPYCASLGL